jgi:hypothetical protein
MTFLLNIRAYFYCWSIKQRFTSEVTRLPSLQFWSYKKDLKHNNFQDSSSRIIPVGLGGGDSLSTAEECFESISDT